MAPARNVKALLAALPHADAVYFGTDRLNMRDRAENVPLARLGEVTSKCHDAGVRAYLATNVLVYDDELPVVDEVFGAAYAADVDAVIVHDVGVIELAKKHGIPFHVSTQANVSNVASAKFYERLGASRVILARELSLAQIKVIARELETCQVEAFVHGAMCTSISGRCYFSADLCGSEEFSANRGKCIQPCRRRFRVVDEENNELLYDGEAFISAKDLCMVGHLPEMLDAGVSSLKIEGRMRRPDYVDTVTRVYREALDAVYDGTYTPEKVREWTQRLRRAYNRGFSTGFYFGRPTPADIEPRVRGNASPWHRVEVGRVVDYFRKARVAKILVTNGSLRVGDDLVIEGVNTDTFVRFVVTSLRIKHESVQETPVGRGGDPIVATVALDEPVKENDRVYKFQRRTQKSD